MGILAYLIAGIALVGALVGGYVKIHHDGYAQGSAEITAKWDAANQEARKREAEQSAKAAADLAAAQAKRITITKERTVYVDRNIEKLVDSGTCLKPAGVLCLNGAINGDKSAAGCDTDRAVPAAKPAG